MLPDFLPTDVAQALDAVQRPETLALGSWMVWHAYVPTHLPNVVLLHGGSRIWTHRVLNIDT